MKKNKILIITSRQDTHTDYIINILYDDGLSENIIRLNTEDFNSNTKVIFTNCSFCININDSNRTFTNEEIVSVWFRRPKPIKLTDQDKYVANFIYKQSNSVLRGLYFCLHDSSLWINPLPSMHRAKNKLQQLHLASKLGFLVPDTLVTNNYVEALLFYNKYGLICNKSLDEPNYYFNGQLFPYLTRLVQSKSELEKNSTGISNCFTLFQQYINKIFDIRVIVINKSVFAFEIYSQDDDMSKIDFRGRSPLKLVHKLHNLPKSLVEKIIEFVRAQGLVYSALDFVYSADNKYYFIENNCNGQWLWLELLTNVKISEELIKALRVGKI
jgi:glutathione synthase/RimK-type ligase-like ATP-grasp enzyme